MISQTKHNNKDYLVVYTDFIVEIDEEIIKIPLTVQFNVTNLDSKKHYLIYQKANYLFNHPIELKKFSKSPASIKKPWYNFW